MAADYDDWLEQKRAERYDGGDEDERGEEEEQDSEGHERRALIEQSLEDDERCLKSHMEVL